MTAIALPIQSAMGASGIKSFPKTQYDKVKEIVDKLNSVSTTNGALKADSITPYTSGGVISMNKAVIYDTTATAVDVTGSITAAQLSGGLITSTSAAAVTATLPTATLLATALGATQGSMFDFIIDNSAGANTVTVQVNTGITVGTTAVTGGISLTVSTAQVVGVFRLIFTSATAAILRRIA
jgi:hypothetical protein